MPPVRHLSPLPRAVPSAVSLQGQVWIWYNAGSLHFENAARSNMSGLLWGFIPLSFQRESASFKQSNQVLSSGGIKVWPSSSYQRQLFFVCLFGLFCFNQTSQANHKIMLVDMIIRLRNLALQPKCWVCREALKSPARKSPRKSLKMPEGATLTCNNSAKVSHLLTWLERKRLPQAAVSLLPAS